MTAGGHAGGGSHGSNGNGRGGAPLAKPPRVSDLEELIRELAARGQVTVSSLGLGGHWVVTVVEIGAASGAVDASSRVPVLRHYAGPDLYRTVRAAHGKLPEGDVP